MATNTNHFDDPVGPPMEALRKLMLHSALSSAFDSLIHQASAVRCITIGRGVQEAIADPRCEEIVRSSGLMQFLREEAVARSSGASVSFPALLPEAPTGVREASHGR